MISLEDKMEEHASQIHVLDKKYERLELQVEHICTEQLKLITSIDKLTITLNSYMQRKFFDIFKDEFKSVMMLSSFIVAIATVGAMMVELKQHYF